ncbi:hypothetical protein SUGI_0812190 [Cryptomeria japonica]|uniref:BOI-related E3 ubiquitin-protein ligase 1 n=1 Tax=Cryptomeria japonica TaxID=3369 RepID=UPI002414AE97|nr:BOI-related E3 ubiquitin-protein ligase 1 [Cryptomeria japonica]XP_057840791.2 BOI-related E3 ubiquitin-protein ligase 1 [Cryptomeria japonica]GLJ39734.1 hypothetical protein SUGI_0812190 [Cryptomeria japonica]
MRNLNAEQRIFSQSAAAINVDYGVPDFKMMPVAAPASLCNRVLQAYPFEGSTFEMATCEPFYPSMAEFNTNMWMCENKNKKRLRESYEPINFVSLEGGLMANPFNMHQQSCVSTALHLNFQENLANYINSSDFNNITPNNNTICASKNLAAEIQRQNDATEQLIRLEQGRTRQLLLEKTENHCKALLCSVALAVSWKLREKGLELLRMNRKNMELEEQIRGLAIESRAWKKRAKCCQAMAVALKLQIEEVNKEGSGDSEEEAFNAVPDISSSSCQIIHSTNNNNSSIYTNIFIENRDLKMQRSCRLCRSKEVRMLLLPCRHLCLCKHCDSILDVCPLCSAHKTASVEIETT